MATEHTSQAYRPSDILPAPQSITIPLPASLRDSVREGLLDCGSLCSLVTSWAFRERAEHMTTLRYCHIHGSFRADYPDSCPSCDLDEFEREDRAEPREANETYKRNNPGDYTCPNCLYITLKSGASRCPKCQGTVDADYW